MRAGRRRAESSWRMCLYGCLLQRHGAARICSQVGPLQGHGSACYALRPRLYIRLLQWHGSAQSLRLRVSVSGFRRREEGEEGGGRQEEG